MRSERDLRLRQLNRKLMVLKELSLLQVPTKGWISEIRRALGMTATQLGKRLGISQPAITQSERNEVSGAITLGKMQNVAAALDCDFVYALVPKTDLSETLERQARKTAQAVVGKVTHSMELENQSVSKEEVEEQIKDLTRRLIEEDPRSLWNTP